MPTKVRRTRKPAAKKAAVKSTQPKDPDADFDLRKEYERSVKPHLQRALEESRRLGIPFLAAAVGHRTHENRSIFAAGSTGGRTLPDQLKAATLLLHPQVDQQLARIVSRAVVATLE